MVLGVIGALASAPMARAITVGPVRLEFFANPGDTVKGTVTVINDGAQEATFYPSFEKFTEDNGNKIFTKETSDIATWFVGLPSVTLKAGEQKEIPFVMDIPRNAPPGGHFAVMWWSTAPPDAHNGQQVSIVTRAGILMYMTVAGDIKEDGALTRFTANGGGSFFFSYPISFSASFRNDGNIYEKPQGNVVVRNMLGLKSVTLPINEPGSNVLPQSTKSFDAVWQSNPWAFGLYYAVATLTYGQNSTPVTASKWFFVLPLWNTIIVVFILIIIFWVLPVGIKRYNKWIVSQASKSHGS